MNQEALLLQGRGGSHSCSFIGYNDLTKSFLGSHRGKRYAALAEPMAGDRLLAGSSGDAG